MPPVPPYFEQRPAKMVRANERDSLRLYCNASGAPQPKIRWWVRLSLPPSPESLNSGSPNQLSDRSRATTRTNSSEKMENSLAIGKELLKPIELILSHYQSGKFLKFFQLLDYRIYVDSFLYLIKLFLNYLYHRIAIYANLTLCNRT